MFIDMYIDILMYRYVYIYCIYPKDYNVPSRLSP